MGAAEDRQPLAANHALETYATCDPAMASPPGVRHALPWIRPERQREREIGKQLTSGWDSPVAASTTHSQPASEPFNAAGKRGPHASGSDPKKCSSFAKICIIMHFFGGTMRLQFAGHRPLKDGGTST
jgi:hypothetical protein